jgi:hypothetical protein
MKKHAPLAINTSLAKVSRATKTSDFMVLPGRAKRWIPKTVITPDYTNQLDLFSEAPIDDAAPVAPQPIHHTHHARPPQQLDFGSLGTLPPFDAGAVEARKPAGESAGGNGGAIHGPAVSTGIGGENGIPSGLGDSRGPVPSAGRVFLEEPEQPSRDFRITDDHRIGLGGAHEKAKANIEAIRLLKTLEAGNRDASDDEKAILARYVGWGGIPGIFESNYRRREEWDKPAEELRKLLTDTEYESARASTPNAHFTSPMVIGAIWDGLQRMGIGKGAQVLEPAVGVGNFFGLQPESMRGPPDRRRARFDHGPHREEALSRFHDISQKGFEETPLPDNYFDAVVGTCHLAITRCTTPR